MKLKLMDIPSEVKTAWVILLDNANGEVPVIQTFLQEDFSRKIMVIFGKEVSRIYVAEPYVGMAIEIGRT
jgi:hypothetical protein